MATTSLRNRMMAKLASVILAATLTVLAAPFAAQVASGTNSGTACLQATPSSTQAFAVSDWSGTVDGKTLDGAIIKMRPHGYFHTANIHNDGIVRGDVIFLYNLGTTSKWKLQTVSGTDYYFIGAYKDFTERREPNSNFFDVDAQSKKSGAIVHSWPGYSASDYSRHWKFERQSNGTYLIINRNSGLYLSLEGDGSDSQGKKFCQSSTPLYWDVEITGVGNHSSSTGNNYDVINKYSTYPGANWMMHVDNSLHLTELSIPGTHDTGTCYTWGDISPGISFTACQQYFIREQLAAGARFFDIRMGIDGVSDLDPYINHGGTVCRTEQEKDMQLSHVMAYFKDFLKQNPSEFIILLASPSGGDVKNQANSLYKYIQDDPGLFYLQKDSTIPTVGELRGKIYLAHRLDLSSTGYSENQLGLNLSSWSKSNFTTSDHKPAKVWTPSLTSVYAQDKYDTNADDKIYYVSTTFAEAAKNPTIYWDTLYINYTSCTKSNPFSAAINMNQRLYKDRYFSGSGNRLGIVVMDFMDAQMAYNVYKQNEGVYESLSAFRNAPLKCTCSVEGTWIHDGKWWYARHDGSYPKNGWEYIDNTWYAFDDEGWMRTGWLSEKGKWYYLRPKTGNMATGWQTVRGNWYYLDPTSGVMQTGWQLIDGVWYYLDPTSGALKSGWVKDGNTWYYLNPTHDGTFGAMKTGWLLDHGTWYYLKDSGAMATRWFKVGDIWYYANGSGTLQSGWLLDDDTWYYLSSTHDGTFGAMQTGWQLIGKRWYFFNDNGAMAANTWIDGYYVNTSGAWEPEKKPETAPKEEIEVAPLPPVTNPDEDAVTEEPETSTEPDETDEPVKTDEIENPFEDASVSNETADESAHESDTPEAEPVLV